MCGRMTQTTDPAEVARIFDADSRVDADDEWAAPRYNVAPTQPLTVVLAAGRRGPRRGAASLGAHPVVREVGEGRRQAHQRAGGDGGHEPVLPDELREAALHRAGRSASTSGAAPAGRKQPFFLHPPEDAVLAMAGLWSVWKDPETGLWVPSAAVVTTDANRLVSSHPRPHAGAAAAGGLGRLARPGGGRPGVPALAAGAGAGRRPRRWSRSRPRSTTCATRAPSSWHRSRRWRHRGCPWGKPWGSAATSRRTEHRGAGRMPGAYWSSTWWHDATRLCLTPLDATTPALLANSHRDRSSFAAPG